MKSLYQQPADIFADTTLLFDLDRCPAGSPGQVAVRQEQPNPLLDNVEGMAVTAPETTGKYRGWRTLYLVSDNNDNNPTQITRLYELRVKVPTARPGPRGPGSGSRTGAAQESLSTAAYETSVQAREGTSVQENLAGYGNDRIRNTTAWL